ncbi:hypothetical protein E1166_09915, partial [Micromonospora sp. KC213]
MPHGTAGETVRLGPAGETVRLGPAGGPGPAGETVRLGASGETVRLGTTGDTVRLGDDPTGWFDGADRTVGLDATWPDAATHPAPPGRPWAGYPESTPARARDAIPTT